MAKWKDDTVKKIIFHQLKKAYKDYKKIKIFIEQSKIKTFGIKQKKVIELKNTLKNRVIFDLIFDKLKEQDELKDKFIHSYEILVNFKTTGISIRVTTIEQGQFINYDINV